MKEYARVKSGCYATNITMAVVCNLPPVLFITFHSLYGVSYSLLGLLVLLNFVTQLSVDLVFSFFSHRFNIPLTIRLTPVIAAAGLAMYALAPILFPNAVFFGLILGTILFSAASGFAEVLMSPVIAAIPAKDPDREMSKLHSIYAWGAVAVVLLSTVFLLYFAETSWMILPAAFALIPVAAAILFSKAKIPQMASPEKVSGGALALCKSKELWLCVLAIFFGGAAECTMSQWSSGYLEQAANIPKVWGDVCGVAMFSLMLAIGRSLYAKIGKHIERVLFAGFVGAVVCYVICALTNLPMIGLITCAFTGFCTSMLWPGSLVVAAERIPTGGVFIYAMMAAGGDLGASLSPQLVGVITDLSVANESLVAMAGNLGLTPEQFGLKLGMLIAAFFPLCGSFLAMKMLVTPKKKPVS